MLNSNSERHPLNSLRKSILANFAGTVVQSLLALIFIPMYIMYLGIEAWGLIGIFASLQVIFGLLDLGISSTLNRELARLSVLPQKEQEIRNLVRTLEVIYWGVAIFVGIIVVALSPLIAHHWINQGKLSAQTIEQAVLIMGFVIALQMPVGFYSGGLMGLQKQVLLNAINIGIGTFRSIGAVLILWLISPTIQAFFLWQILVSIINISLLAIFLWNRLPQSHNKAVFQKQLLKGVWKFAAGMSGISILSVILTQLDKVILSKMLPLETFGYYALASMVAMSLGRIFTPVFYSIYPRFTQLVAVNDQDRLKQLYHKSCQFVSVLILPVAIVVTLFSYEIILIWTQSPVTAEKSHILVRILICGTAINGLMNLPYALQLAYGWTKLSFLKNIIAVIMLIPLIIYMTNVYGAIGAAIVWLALNLGYIIFEIPIMHIRLLQTEKWKWYWRDIGIPVIAGVTTAGLGKIFIVESMPEFRMLQYLIIISVLTFVATLFSAPAMREVFYSQLLRLKMYFK
jgi:O-antigen/teichoic acid export membrane protein